MSLEKLIDDKISHLLMKIDKQKLPEHVAIIMDCNGRWATKKGLPRSFGHKQGVNVLKEIIKVSKNLGCKVLTVYAFSTENWTRPTKEVDFLINLFSEVLKNEIKEIHEESTKIKFIGDLTPFPKSLKEIISTSESLTKNNNKFLLNVCVNYGGRQEIVKVAKELALKNELALMGPMGSLEAYISIVNQTPVLSREEERELAYRFQNENDLDAARKLILSQLRFVVHIARTYSGYGLPLADLIQEGNIGLMKAVKKFNPDRGTRLVTYAVHWIRSEIHEFVFNNWKIVKVPTTKAQRKLFFKLRNAKKSIGWLTNDEKKLIAKDLGVKPTDVATMEQRFASVDMPYDLGHTDSDEDYISPAGFLPSPDSDPSSIVENDNWLQGKKEQLSSALEGLDKRSKEILMSRWLTDEKVTLKELAKQYQVSIERIRQIEEEAIQELREHLTEA